MYQAPTKTVPMFLYAAQPGCVQNFADFCDPKTGRIPVVITEKFAFPGEADKGVTNASKPVLIQHALFICRLHKDYEYPLFVPEEMNTCASLTVQSLKKPATILNKAIDILATGVIMLLENVRCKAGAALHLFLL